MMDRIKTRLIIAVTSRLSAAADTNAKTELIEELSDNLYQRYLDLTAAGVAEDAAYAKALEDLGDVDELLEYLRSLGPEGELPRQDGGHAGINIDDIVRGAEDIVRETISQTRDAVGQAKVIARDVARKLKDKYPNGFSAEVHFDTGPDDDHGEHPEGEKAPRDIVYGIGYDRKKGGFFTQWGEYRGPNVEGTTIPSADLRRLDMHLINGDVNIRVDPDPQADVVLTGGTDELDIRLNEEGLLSIRPGKTASSSFFSLRGLVSDDVYLTLPARHWEAIFISTVNGDVDVCDGLDTDRLTIKTASGDVDLRGGAGDVRIDSASGDVDLYGGFSSVVVNTASGDIDLDGSAHTLRCASASGDVDLRLASLPRSLDASTKSGDCEVSVPGGLGFTLRFRTVSGDLSTDFSMVGPIAARSGEAVYLDGGESTINISSVSGDISLLQL